MATKKKAAPAKKGVQKQLKKHAPRKAAKTAGKKSAEQQDRRKMNAGEAIINFVGRLTTRKLPLVFSSSSDCAPIMEVASEFMRVNNLPDVRDDFPASKPMPATEHLTNVANSNCCVKLSPQETFRMVITAIRQHDRNQQNEIIANLLFEIETERINRVNAIKNDMDSLEKQQFQAMTTLNGLQEIRKGAFDTLAFTKIPMLDILQGKKSTED